MSATTLSATRTRTTRFTRAMSKNRACVDSGTRMSSGVRPLPFVWPPTAASATQSASKPPEETRANVSVVNVSNSTPSTESRGGCTRFTLRSFHSPVGWSPAMVARASRRSASR